MSKSEFMLLDVAIIGAPSTVRSLIQMIFFNAYIRNLNNFRFDKDLYRQISQLKGFNSRSPLWFGTWNPEDLRTAQEFWRDQDGLILVYDATNLQTLEYMDNWLRNCDDLKGGRHMGKLLVGWNRGLGDDVQVTKERLEQFASEHKGLIFAEIIVNDGSDIDKGFRNLLKTIIENRLSETSVSTEAETNTHIPQPLEPGVPKDYFHEGNAVLKEPGLQGRLKVKRVAVRNTLEGDYSRHFAINGTGEEGDPAVAKLEMSGVKLHVGYKVEKQGRERAHLCSVQ